MNSQERINMLITSLTGANEYIKIPMVYLKLTEEYPTAMLLNRLVYWSEMNQDDKNYFPRKIDEWKEETLLSDYQIRRAMNKLKEMNFVETALKKVNGVPTTHYKVNHLNILESITEKLIRKGV